MNRRQLLSGTANTLGALTLAGGTRAASQEAPQPAKRRANGAGRPNILVLMSDQHKRSCMGVAGDQVAHTPHLDALAAQGVRFTNAYCPNPVCGPSRASMLTGLYSHSLGSRGNSHAFPKRCTTVAHDMNSAGYTIGLIGKMHFNDGQRHGFDYNLDFNEWFQQIGPKTKLYADEVGHNDSGAGQPQIESLWSGGDPWKGVRELDDREGPVAVGRPSKMEEKDHFESFVARESVRFLEQYGDGEQPFFLIASFLKPHEPFMPAQRFAAMYTAEQMQLSPSWHKVDPATMPAEVRASFDERVFTPELKNPAAARERMACYYSNVAQMDDCAGQVLAALTRLHLDSNTVVIYTADHGDMLGDLGLWGKTQMYEGSCGVPLVVRAPGVPPAVCSKPVSLISLVATCAEIGAVPNPRATAGKSLVPLLTHPDAGSHEEPVFAEFSVGGGKAEKYLIRKGTLKYTYRPHDLSEFYDLASDPMEIHNLVNDPEHAATVAQLQRELFAWYTPAETPRNVPPVRQDGAL